MKCYFQYHYIIDVIFACCFLNIKEDEQSNPCNTNNTVRQMSLDGFVFLTPGHQKATRLYSNAVSCS